MPKYSTGNSSAPDPNDDDASCALCGTQDGTLKLVKIAGAAVLACKDCNSESGSSSKKSTTKSDDESYDTESSKGQSSTSSNHDSPGGYTITNPDSSWVETDRPDYGNVETPYLVPRYSTKLVEERESQNLSIEELAEMAGLSSETIQSLEDGNAVQDDIGKAAVSAVEDALDIELQEEA